MPKTVHLIRHAKSSWKDPTIEDIDRPLNKRGKQDCQIMAKQIEMEGCDWKNIYCSPAKRAQKTLQGILKNLKRPSRWQTEEALYTFDVNDLIAWCKNLNNNLDSVAIVGHNPALTELIHYFVQNASLSNFPTCAYARIDIHCDQWEKIDKHCGELKVFIKPKDYKF